RVLAAVGAGVEHQRVPLEEFVLVLLDNRLAGARVALPVELLQRVARPIVAQADEFLGVTDRSGKRDAAELKAARAREGKLRKAVALGQRDQAIGRGNARKAAHQAEEVGARGGEPGELDAPAPP